MPRKRKSKVKTPPPPGPSTVSKDQDQNPQHNTDENQIQENGRPSQSEEEATGEEPQCMDVKDSQDEGTSNCDPDVEVLYARNTAAEGDKKENKQSKDPGTMEDDESHKELGNSDEGPLTEQSKAEMYCRTIPSLLKKAQMEWDERKKENKTCPRPVKANTLQAMAQAHEAMEIFLKNPRSGIMPQQLADWLGQCAFILHEIKFNIQAIRCFYSAIVFDANWSIQDHKPVATTLWDALLTQTNLQPMFMGIIDVLKWIFEVARLAFRRRLYEIGSVTCRELDGAYKRLLKHQNLWPMEGKTIREMYHSLIKPVILCHAECQLYMIIHRLITNLLLMLTNEEDRKFGQNHLWNYLGNYILVKTICAAVLKEMCEYNCAKAFELWGIALLKEGNNKVARMKLESAIVYAQSDEYSTYLQQLFDRTPLDVAHSKRDETPCDGKKPNGERSSQTTVFQISSHPTNDGHTLQLHGQKQQPMKKERDNAPRFRERRKAPIISLPSGTSQSARGGHSSQGSTEDAGDEFERLQLSLDASAVLPPADTKDEWEEHTSFYDQSCLFYNRSDREIPTTDEGLLQNGIQLNRSYMTQYQDKHESNYNRDPYYSNFASENELKQKLRRRDKFLRCELNIESAHLSYCKPFEPVPNVERVEISGRSKCGQAFSGDEVVVKLIDNKHDGDGKRFGEVVGILNRRRYNGVEHPVFICNLDDMETHLMRPICKTLPKISVLNQTIRYDWPRLKRYLVEVYTYDAESETLGDPQLITVNLGDIQRYVFLVAFINWSPRHIYPRGAVIKVLPCGDSLSAGLRLLGLQYHVPSVYQKSVVDHMEHTMPDLLGGINPADYPDRQDLTDLTCFTIDPDGSKDLDDALSVQKVGDKYEVGVHIADVSCFVKKGDACDQDAECRTTTYYPGIKGRLPRPMLPEPLSNHVCSLLPDTCRLTLSVMLTVDKLSRGQIVRVDIRKTVIKSSQQFTYNQVQTIITGKQHKFRKEIMWLYELATNIRRERLGNAMFAVDLSNEENESDDAIVDSLEAHYLIEEFMILANKAVAEKLVRHFPNFVPLRTQPPPAKENMVDFMEKHGSLLDVLVKLQDKKISDERTPQIGNILRPRGPCNEAASQNNNVPSNEANSQNIIVPKHIWEMVEACSRNEQGNFVSENNVQKVLCIDDLYPLQHLIYQEWLSLRKPAEYRCTGTWGHGDLEHYELQVFPYTHFTSPIRRYIDLVIHRLIHAYLDGERSPYITAEINTICNHVNAVSRQAKAYQRNCQLLKHAVDLKRNPKMALAFIDDLSDRSVTLSSFDLKYVKKDHRVMPFNLLDMGYKPEVDKDPATNTDIINAVWRKRLYDFNSKSQPSVFLPNRSDRDKRLNPHEGVVYVPLHQWTRILKCAMSGHKQDMKKCIRDATAQTLGRGYSKDVCTETQNMAKNPSTTFSLTFSHGQTVKTQLTAVPLKGILTPKPMLYNMTNNVKLCLQHIDDAVFYLSEYVCKPTCDMYRNLSMYIERWVPIIHMEAATCAVANEESCVINNVPVEFVNKQEGKMTFSLEFCEIRNIEFSGTLSETKDENEKECFQAYDWLCIRYTGSESEITTKRSTPKLHPTLKSVWVGHAEVTSVKKQEADKKMRADGKLFVRFRLHPLCPSLQDEMMRKGARFCVEILRKSEVDRRTESFLKKLEDEDYKDILAQKIALNRPIPALDALHIEMANSIEQDVSAPPSRDTPALPRNNRRQKEAISKAMRNRLTLIQGPPGTGKSYTGIKLLYLFDKINTMITKEGRGPHKQVLFCGPSNKAVDVVAKMMLMKLGPLCPKFVRVYGRSIEALDFPIPGRTFFSKKSTRASKTDEMLKDYALHHLIRNEDRPLAAKIKEYDQMFADNGYEASPDTVKKYVQLLSEASIEELQAYSVILCTTGVGANPKILKASSVYQVVIDEAGMCSEPECLMPIIATKAEQVVLIGDHKQLRPIIICKRAAELGLETSLFERYAYSNSAERVQFTMLNKQYRMNPELCKFPSNQFYEAKLLTEICAAWRNDRLAHIWPANEQTGNWYPHVLIHVEGEEESLSVSTEEGNEQSKSNMQEVEIAVNLFRYFIDNGMDGNRINLISQYNAQCAQIRKRLDEEGFVPENYNVSTVVSSQGGEWEYVIFSTVRSLPDYKIEKNPTLGWCKQNLGFITDQNQINVALTRAKKGLIIIGNTNLLRCDKVWKNLISDYEDSDCIKTLSEFPPKTTRMQRQEAAQMRNEDMYGEEKYIPGLATSFGGQIPQEDIVLEEDEGYVRNMKRGMRKTLVNRKKQPPFGDDRRANIQPENEQTEQRITHVLKPGEEHGKSLSVTKEKVENQSKRNPVKQKTQCMDVKDSQNEGTSNCGPGVEVLYARKTEVKDDRKKKKQKKAPGTIEDAESHKELRSSVKGPLTRQSKVEMNRELRQFHSDYFYERETLTEMQTTCSNNKPDSISISPMDEMVFWFPNALIHVEGPEEGNKKSKQNMAEIETVVNLFRYFIDNGVNGNKINVISQYNAQCAQIRRRLDQEGFVPENYNVSTVVSSQDGTWDYVIFTTVRSLSHSAGAKSRTDDSCEYNLGFKKDQDQINVALARAKIMLIIVGNAKSLQRDVFWKSLIPQYEARNCIKTLSEFLRDEATIAARSVV